MATTLEMVFKNAGNKNFTISLDAPRDNLTGAEVKTVMADIIARNIFMTSGGDVTQLDSAHIINRDVTELELQ